MIVRVGWMLLSVVEHQTKLCKSGAVFGAPVRIPHAVDDPLENSAGSLRINSAIMTVCDALTLCERGLGKFLWAAVSGYRLTNHGRLVAVDCACRVW